MIGMSPELKTPSHDRIKKVLADQGLDLGDKTPKSIAELHALISGMEKDLQLQIADIEARMKKTDDEIAELERKLAPTQEEIVQSVNDQDIGTVAHNEAVIQEAVTRADTEEQFAISQVPPAAGPDKKGFLKRAVDSIMERTPAIGKAARWLRNTALMGGIFVMSTGFVGKNGDGGYQVESFSTHNVLDRMTEILPEKQEQWAKRFLEKHGLYESEDVQFVAPIEETSHAHLLTPQDMMMERHQEMMDSVTAAQRHEKEMREYHESVKQFKILGTVPDCYNKNDSIFSYRSQWFNDEGFTYVAGPNVGQQKDANVKFKDVIGVGHFLLDGSLFGGTPYSHSYNQAYIQKAKKNNDYLPCFHYTGSNQVRVQYKRAAEVAPDDIIVSPLRQFKLSDINFGQKIAMPKEFAYGIWTNPTSDGRESLLIFKSRDGYNRFSGGSVVFIFEDQFGNEIVRDFAGTNRQIEQEGKNILTEFGITADKVTIGYHDVGSFSAKPKAKNGTLQSKQWAGYNNNTYTGGALLIPTSVIGS